MLAVRRVCLGSSLLFVCVVGCDRSPPTAPPTVEAASTARGGPTVKAPSSPTAIALSESQIDVAWQDNSTNETGFEVHRATGGASATFAPLASTAAGVVSYSNVGLTPSTQYCYKVRAFRKYDGKTTYSEFSTAACATTPALPAPAAPTGTDARPAFSTVVDVRWIDNSRHGESGHARYLGRPAKEVLPDAALQLSYDRLRAQIPTVELAALFAVGAQRGIRAGF